MLVKVRFQACWPKNWVVCMLIQEQCFVVWLGGGNNLTALKMMMHAGNPDTSCQDMQSCGIDFDSMIKATVASKETIADRRKSSPKIGSANRGS